MQTGGLHCLLVAVFVLLLEIVLYTVMYVR